jgi:phosphonate transport system ATP-binding protein
MAALIKVCGVSKRYSTGRLALEDISLEFEPGQVAAILGPSGSGKSTLLRCMNGLETPTSGEIWVDGLKVEKKTVREVRKRLGMVFQQHNLVPRLNALTNVLTGRLSHVPWFWSLFYLFPKGDVELAHAALAQVGLSEQTWQRADKLSGGQQQRVSIARAVVQKPKGILADEPVASLDPATSNEVLRLLVHAAREEGLALVINLHQVELATIYCDRIIGLRQGRLAFDCTKNQLDENMLNRLYDPLVTVA